MLTTICCNFVKADFYIGAQGGVAIDRGQTTISHKDESLLTLENNTNKVNKILGVFIGYDITMPSGLYIALQINGLSSNLHHAVMPENPQLSIILKRNALSGPGVQLGYALQNNVILFAELSALMSEYTQELKIFGKGDSLDKGLGIGPAIGLGVKYKINPWVFNLKYNYLRTTIPVKENKDDKDISSSYKFAEHIVTLGAGYNF